MEKGQLRWVNCGNDKLGHLNLKQITTFGGKTKVPFSNLIYYNTTKHESHTKQKEKTLCPHPLESKKWNREWTQNPNGDGDGEVTELTAVDVGWRS